MLTSFKCSVLVLKDVANLFKFKVEYGKEHKSVKFQSTKQILLFFPLERHKVIGP